MAAVKSQPVAFELEAPATVTVRDFDAGISNHWDLFSPLASRQRPSILLLGCGRFRAHSNIKIARSMQRGQARSPVCCLSSWYRTGL